MRADRKVVCDSCYRLPDPRPFRSCRGCKALLKRIERLDPAIRKKYNEAGEKWRQKNREKANLARNRLRASRKLTLLPEDWFE